MYFGKDNFRDFSIFSISCATAAGIFISISTILFVFDNAFYSGFHDTIFDKIKYYESDGFYSFVRYLISPNNEHRITTSRFFFVIDEILFSGKEQFVVLSNLFIQFLNTLIAFLFFRATMKNVIDAISARFFVYAFLFSFIFLHFFNSVFIYTLLIGFQIQHAIMAMLCLLVACALAYASGQPKLPTKFLTLTLLALAFVATFTLGNASVILLSATAVALILRWPLQLFAGLAGLALLHTGLMLATSPSVGARSADAFAIGKFLMVYLGSPFLRIDPWPAPYATYGQYPYLAAAFGAIILAIAAATVVLRLVRPGFGGALTVFGVALLAMVIITGLAAGSSRVQFGVLEAANKKYASFAALAWLGATAIICGVLSDIRSIRSYFSLVPLFSSFLVVLYLSIIGYPRETKIWSKYVDVNREAATALVSAVGASAPLRELYVEEAGLQRYFDFIETRWRGPFAHFPTRWGQDVTVFLARLREEACRGEVEMATPWPAENRTDVFSRTGTPISISGWAFMGEDRAPPAFVLAADTNGRVAGIAVASRQSSRAEQWLGQKFQANLGWFGYARVAAPGSLDFFALSGNGRTYCRLGQVAVVP